MKIFSFVAASANSGKTTLIEKIVPLLKERGLRVAVVKHASAGFDLDERGKDSWRFQQAGADAVLLAGPKRFALIRMTPQPPTQEQIEALFPDMDILLQEGFKKDAKNKIEVFRSGISGEQPLCANDDTFLALVSDRPAAVAVPQFDLNDARGVADLLLSKLQL